MKNKNEKKINDSREKLIENMRDLLWEKGYSGTSPKLIQKRADVGQGSMYHHFSSKADLALEAIKRNIKELQSKNELIFLDKEKTSLQKIKSYILFPRDENILKGCKIGSLTQDSDVIERNELREPLNETFKWLIQSISEIITEGQLSGELKKDINSYEAASMIVAVIQGGYVLAKAENSIEAFHQAVSGLDKLINTFEVDK